MSEFSVVLALFMATKFTDELLLTAILPLTSIALHIASKCGNSSFASVLLEQKLAFFTAIKLCTNTGKTIS